MDMYNFFSTFSKGLKPAAIAELEKSGAVINNCIATSVDFSASLEKIPVILYNSRVLNKIVWLVIDKCRCNDYETLYRKIKQFRWEKYFSEKQSIKINFSSFNSELANSHYATQKIKDAVCDRFREYNNCRPDVDIENPDVIIEARIINGLLEAGFSITNFPLFKRGYRTMTNAAPLKETLAAGLYHFVQPHNYKRIIDPMCGSGTVIIETAFRLLNLPAVSAHQSFIQKKFKIGCPQIRKTANNFEFICADKTQAFVDIAEANIKSAKLSNCIKTIKQDFFEPVTDMSNSLLIFNAPYGERLHKGSDIDTFYKNIGDTLKKHCKNSTAYILTNFDEHIKHIGLKPSKRIELFNGKIECRLLEYKIF